MPLTDVAVRSAKPRPKPYKLSDERGLYLLCTPTGGRLWRFKYRVGRIEKLLALGAYPDVPLKKARDRRDEARRLVADGIDPSAKKKADKKAEVDTVKGVAEEWLTKQTSAPGTRKRDRDRLANFIFPKLGKRPIRTVTPPELLAVLRPIEARGTIETALRTRAVCGRVWRYAVATGHADRDITADLKGALSTKAVTSHAAITDPKRIGELLRAIDGYVGQPATHAALRLAPLVFVRPGELRAAEWAEIDLDKAEWRIPFERMKMRQQHLVPLATQAIAILDGIKEITGSGRYVFPSLRSDSRPLSDNTINAALRRLGYSNTDMTGHGFRSMASTLLNEQGWHPDLIELQLAHAERNKNRAAYNRAERLVERRKMMQAWADYLDGLRASNNVVAIGAAR
jgi:integrase